MEELNKARNRKKIVMTHIEQKVDAQQLEQPPPVLPQNINVLIVDSDPSTRDVIAGLLYSFEYQVTFANSSQEAIAKLQETDLVDLVLIDMGVQMDGILILKQIKNNPILNEIPVVMISGSESTAVNHECLQIGAADFFAKPVTRKEIQFVWKFVAKSPRQILKNQNQNLIGLKRRRESENQNPNLVEQIEQQEKIQIIEKYVKLNKNNEENDFFHQFQISESMTLERFLQRFKQEQKLDLNQKMCIFFNLIKSVENNLEEGIFLTLSNIIIFQNEINLNKNLTGEGESEIIFLPPWDLKNSGKTAYFLGYVFFHLIFNDDNFFDNNESWKQIVQDTQMGILNQFFSNSNQIFQKFGQFIQNLISYSKNPTWNLQIFLHSFVSEIKYLLSLNLEQIESDSVMFFMHSMKQNLQQKIDQADSELKLINLGLKNVDEFFQTLFNSSSNSKQLNLQNCQQMNSEEAIQEANRRFSNVSNITQIKSQFLNQTQNPVQIERFSKELFDFSKYGKLRIRSETRNLDISRPDSLPCGIGFDCRDEFFAVASTDKTVKLYDYNKFDDEDILMHYPIDEIESRSKLSCVCWSPYLQSHIALSDHDGIISMWDVNRHQLVQLFEQHTKRVWSVDFCRTQPTLLASASDDGTVHIWNMFHSESVQNVEVKSQVCSVQFDPQNCNIIAVGCTNNRAYRYDLRKISEGPISTLKGHKRTVSYVRFINSNQLVTSSTDSTAKLWDVSGQGNEEASLMHCYNEHVNVRNFVGCATLPSGYVAMGSENSSVYVYSTSFSNSVASYQFQYKDTKQKVKQQPFLSCMAWNQQKGTLLVGSSVGALHLMELA